MPTLSPDLKQHYDEYYRDGGESTWRELGAKHKAANIVRVCGHLAPRAVLDIGGGEGAVASALRSFCDDITCLEVSESGLAAITERGIRAEQFDGYTIPFEDNAFDLAIASHVVEHVEHERTFLAEASRVARHLYVEVPLEDTVRLPLDYVDDGVGHINHYNFRTFRQLLQTTGLEVLRQEVFEIPLDMQTFMGGWKGYVRYGIRRATAGVSRPLAMRLFGYHCGALCRR